MGSRLTACRRHYLQRLQGCKGPNRCCCGGEVKGGAQRTGGECLARNDTLLHLDGLKAVQARVMAGPRTPRQRTTGVRRPASPKFRSFSGPSSSALPRLVRPAQNRIRRGENVTTLLKAQVVYYSGRTDELEEQGEHYPTLVDWVSENKSASGTWSSRCAGPCIPLE
ncbi:hypothetical protein VTI74DRAFT_8232 [Chaetomium olivicolor]